MLSEKNKEMELTEYPPISAHTIIESDNKGTRRESEFLKEMIHNYYRQPLLFPLDLYKNIDKQPIDIRMNLKKDPFYKKVGQYIHVLDFSETERIRFAHEAESNELIVFLLFERNTEVLEAVFNNPRLPVKNLMDFINLIKERDINREDDKILKLAQRTLKQRSQRIVKAKDIQSKGQEPLNHSKIISLFNYLWDDDPLIRQASSNMLSMIDWKMLNDLLNQPDLIYRIHEAAPQIPGTEIFSLLEITIRLVLKIYKTQVMLGQHEEKYYDQIYQTLFQSLYHAKTRLLDTISEDPTDEFHLGLLAWYYTDNDPSIIKRIHTLLSLDDLFELLNDPSTPRRIVLPILAVLERHSLPAVVQRVSETRIRLAERDNKKLKEIEVSVNAYFDVIFQSLGYVRINDRKEAIQILKSALSFIHQYHVETQSVDLNQLNQTDAFLNDAINHFQNTIHRLYTDTKKDLLGEIQQIASMVQHVIDLKAFKFDEEIGNESEEPDPELMNKASTIWRISISRYLGRIKDLDEMLHLKLIKIMQEIHPEEKIESLEDELHIASMEIENTHKEAVECKLKIPCRECKRRACASERFLLQCNFLLEEISTKAQFMK